MPTTKRILADQTLYYIASGYPDVAQSVQREDIYKRIEQSVNSAFAMQQFTINLPAGGTIPNNLALATYENVAIEPASNVKSKSTLPVMPVFLPRNAGIHEIRPVIHGNGGDRLLGPPMIPVQAGQGYLLQSDVLLSELFGQVSYEPNGLTVLYSKNLKTLGFSAVDMKLVVFDMSQYGESDVLPIPSDMEDKIIQDLVKFFVPVGSEPSLVSNYPTPKTTDQ